MHRNLRRGVVALATTFACLALLADVASAATLTVDIAGGTITFINTTATSTDEIPLGPGVTTLGTDCASSIVVTTTATTTSVTAWNITTFGVVFRFKWATTWYIADMTRTSSTSGTVTAVTTTSATLNSSTLTLAINFYTATDQTDTGTSCSHGTTRKSRFASVSLSLQGTYSGSTGNIHTPTTSDEGCMSGAGTLGTVTPPSTAPFTTYNAGTLTITDLAVHLL